MDLQPKKKIPADKAVSVTAAFVLLAVAVALLVLYGITRYQGLLYAGLLQLLPGLINLLLLLPKGTHTEEAVIPEQAQQPEKKKKGNGLTPAQRRKKQRIAAQNFWADRGSAVLTAAIFLLIVVISYCFFTLPAAQVQKLNYFIPVCVVVLFVVSIIVEMLCKHTAAREEETQQADQKTHALLRNIRSALLMGRIAQILLVAAMLLKLLNIYDASTILRILMIVLFAYEAVFLAFSLAVRVIRKELQTCPEFLVSLPGLGGSDMGIISYLEKNTGITMRSLWSIKLMKELIPGAIMTVALLLWISTSIVGVEAYQEGAVYRMGNLQADTLKPGLHLVLPWPFDRVEVYDTKAVSSMTIGYEGEENAANIWGSAHNNTEYRLLMGDGKEMVSINLRLEYRIDDLYNYLKNSASPEALLKAAAYEVVTESTIATDINTLLSVDREAFSETFREKLVKRVENHRIGLAVVDVVLESIHPPVEVARTYQEIISSGIVAERIILEAQGAAELEKLNAQVTAQTRTNNARIEQKQKLAEAMSAVSTFLASAEADEAYRSEYRYYKYMTALTQAYANGTLVIVGDGIDSSNIYIGNIDKVYKADKTPVFPEGEVEEFDESIE